MVWIRTVSRFCDPPAEGTGAMSKRDANAFTEMLESDWELAERVRVAAFEAAGEAMGVLVKQAGALGLEFSEDELAEVLEERRAADTSLVDGSVLDEAELAQVSGGYMSGATKNYECKSTYIDGENCSHDDRCNSVYHFYKQRDICKYTYDPTESCWVLDRCYAGE